MVYDPNIPQPNDDPADSQDDILQNFEVINTQFGVNHNPLTTTSPQAGYHKKLFFPTGLVADPNLVAPEHSLYTKLVSGVAQLFFQNGSSSSDVQQLTHIEPTQTGSDYFIQTPFGIKMAYGQFTATGSTATIVFGGTFTAAQAAHGTQIDNATGGSRACTVVQGSLSTTGVQFFVSNTGASGYYFVVGV